MEWTNGSDLTNEWNGMDNGMDRNGMDRMDGTDDRYTTAGTSFRKPDPGWLVSR